MAAATAAVLPSAARKLWLAQPPAQQFLPRLLGSVPIVVARLAAHGAVHEGALAVVRGP